MIRGINWRENPAIRAAVIFIIGIVVGNVVDIQPKLLVSGLFLLIIISFLVVGKKQLSDRQTLLSSIFLLLIGFFMGFTRVQLAKTDHDPIHYNNYAQDGKDTIICKVVEALKYKNSIKTVAEVIRLNGADCRGKLLVYFLKEMDLKHITIGDYLAAETDILPTRRNTNPHAFDYQAYLKNRSIDYQVYLRKGKFQKVKDGNLRWLYQFAHDLRERALVILETRLATKDQLATASAMILGYRDHISEELYQAYATTGSVHVLAVSGLHVGIVCMIFMFLFNRIKSEHAAVKIFKAVVLVSVVWFYAILTGAAPAVIRAAVMFTIVIIGRYWFDNHKIYNTLAISAIILLMYDPYLLFQASFQFSYLALTSIIFFHGRMYKRVVTPFKLPNYFINLGVVAVAAQVLVFPVTVYYFHKFPRYFIVSGIFSVMFAGIIVILGLMLLCLSSVPLIGDFLGLFLRWTLDVFIYIIYLIRDWPGSNIAGIWFSTSTTIWIYIGIGFIMYLLYNRRNMVLWSGLTVVLLALVYNRTTFQHDSLYQSGVQVYDVGQSSLIDIYDGQRVYTLRSESIKESSEIFAAENNRYSRNVKEIVPLSTTSHIVKNGLIQHGRDVLFIPSLRSDETYPCETDYLLLSNGDKLWPSNLKWTFIRKGIVVDKSVSYGHTKVWKEFAHEENLPIHVVREDGAWGLD